MDFQKGGEGKNTINHSGAIEKQQEWVNRVEVDDLSERSDDSILLNNQFGFRKERSTVNFGQASDQNYSDRVPKEATDYLLLCECLQ